MSHHHHQVLEGELSHFTQLELRYHKSPTITLVVILPY